MTLELIVVANASQARMLSRASLNATLEPLAELVHPGGRAKGLELDDARPGHGGSDHHPGGVRFEPRLDSRRKQHRLFAKEISKWIEDALASGAYHGISLFASSPFLGELKAQLGPKARKTMQAAIDTDLSSFHHQALAHRVEDALRWQSGHGQLVH